MIKKPVTKQPARREPEEEVEEAPKKKLLKKRQPEPEPEDDPDADADDPDAEPEPPVRKGSGLKKKVKEKSKSFADIFDSTKPGRGLLPPGDYKAYVTGFQLEGDIAEEGEEQDKLKVKVVYEIHEDEDAEVAGKTISQWYGLADDDGAPGPGIPFLKGDLDVLGYEDVLLEDLEEIFADVEAERPQVLIKVKPNGQYTNAYLQGLADTE